MSVRKKVDPGQLRRWHPRYLTKGRSEIFMVVGVALDRPPLSIDPCWSVMVEGKCDHAYESDIYEMSDVINEVE